MQKLNKTSFYAPPALCKAAIKPFSFFPWNLLTFLLSGSGSVSRQPEVSGVVSCVASRHANAKRTAATFARLGPLVFFTPKGRESRRGVDGVLLHKQASAKPLLRQLSDRAPVATRCSECLFVETSGSSTSTADPIGGYDLLHISGEAMRSSLKVGSATVPRPGVLYVAANLKRWLGIGYISQSTLSIMYSFLVSFEVI